MSEKCHHIAFFILFHFRASVIYANPSIPPSVLSYPFSHMCMTMRGVDKPGATTITSYFLGAFKEQADLRTEFFLKCSSVPRGVIGK